MNVSNAHGMFVTGLEFLPTSLDGPAVTCPYEAAVVSISVDNRVCIHQVPFRRKSICLTPFDWSCAHGWLFIRL